MKVHYLATPYENYPYGKDQACADAELAGAALIDSGLLVYCPIPHYHRIAKRVQREPFMPWPDMQLPYLEMAHTLVITMMPGWNESKGISFERDFCETYGKPIRYLQWPLPVERDSGIRLLLDYGVAGGVTSMSKW